jgi:HSP20 family protein
MAEPSLVWLRDEMDALFNRFFGRWPGGWDSGWGLERLRDVEVNETDNEIVVPAEAPGFEPKDFDIHVSGNMLTIRAEHKKEQEGKEEGFRRWQQRFGRLERSISLSTAVDPDNVDARYRSGVLEIHLPRTEPRPRRRIEVKT